MYVGNNPVNLIDPSGLSAFGANTGSTIGTAIGSVFDDHGYVNTTDIHNTIGSSSESAQQPLNYDRLIEVDARTRAVNTARNNAAVAAQTGWDDFFRAQWQGNVAGLQGARGGASIAANTFTFGGTNYVGLTDSNQYQGSAYTGSRVASTISRETLITAATLGTAQVARGGVAGASWSARLINAGASSQRIHNASRTVATGLTAYDLGSGGYHVGQGAMRVYEGDRWGWLEIATGGLQLGGGAASIRELRQPQLGGAFRDVPARGGEVHHAPAKSASSFIPADSPAFRMEIADHATTKSYALVKGSRKYIAAQRAMVESGNFRGAVNMDISDVQSRFGAKYNQGIQEMLNYLNRIGKR
jgi:hypothetical protein